MERGRPTTGARELEQRSLTGVTLDLFLDLFFHSIKVEARRCLHRRVLDSRLSQLHDRLLHEHEAPELTAHEIIHVAATSIVETLTTI